MANDSFFNEPEQPKTESAPEGASEEPAKIKLGDSEYSPQELQEMVGYASKVKEFEKKAGTDFDGLTSSWGKRGEEIGKLKKELEEARAAKMQEKVQAGETLSEEEQIRQAHEQARKLRLVTDDYLDTYLENKLNMREQAKDMLSRCKKHESEIDGKDGRPAFKTPEMLAYMTQTKINDPLIAYKIRFEKEIDRWKEEKLRGAKPRGLFTESTSTAGGKQPPQVKVTRDNLYQVVSETLHGRE